MQFIKYKRLSLYFLLSEVFYLSSVSAGFSVLNTNTLNLYVNDGIDFQSFSYFSISVDSVIIRRKVIKDTNTMKGYKIEVDFPEILLPPELEKISNFNFKINDPNRTEIKKIKKYNEIIRKFINRELSFFENNTREVDSASEQLRNFKFEMNYQICCNKNYVLSILFSGLYFTGEAYPYSKKFSLNFDLSTGNELTLSDLFRKNSDYLKKISTYCFNVLHNQSAVKNLGLDKQWLIKGTEPYEENFRCFNIVADSLLFTFNICHVGLYYTEPREVSIPFSLLKEYIKSKYLHIFNY